ncbi:MAG: MerR family transcriptional regulator [Ornithinimicrobium sp.]
MISIGEFARLGQVSVRMLRHYDRIALLPPADIDPHSGYRQYAAEQLARLNRIVALKDLGFTLEQVGSIVDGGVDPEELRGMLRLRHAELESEESLARDRLSGVEHRLRLIEKEQTMSDTEYVVKSLPAVRLAAKQATVESQPDIAEFVGPAFAELATAVSRAGGSLQVAMAQYAMSENEIEVTAGFGCTGSVPGARTVDLPPVDTAVCAVHLGSMDGIGAAWQQLSRWASDQGWSPSGPCRENYVKADPAYDQSEWVTELQQPVTRAP